MRSPPGAGVSETRIVSPMPSCSTTPIAALDATTPFAPMPGFGQSEMQRIVAARRQRAINVNQILHAADFRAQNNLVRTQAELLRQSAEFSALTTIASIVTSRASFGSASCEFSSIMRVSSV